MSGHWVGQRWGRHVAACGAMIAAASIWALWPMPETTIAWSTQEASAPSLDREIQSLDQAAFAAPIWYVAPPPAAVAAPKPPPPQPPLKLQLIAIVYEDGAPRAVLYDPDHDAMISVGIGQEVAQGRVIESINSSAVVVRDGERTVALSLAGGGS